jgi:hypothetical protein
VHETSAGRTGQLLLVVVALAACGGCARSAADRGTGWWRVTTEHVRLDTDLDRDRAVTAGWALEDLHRAVVSAFPTCDAAHLPPMNVTMIARGDDYEVLAPPGNAAYQPSRPGIVGARPMLLTRPGTYAEEPFAHELTHRLVAACHPSAPPWLREGLAHYFETIQIGDDELIVGISAFHVTGSGPISTVFHVGRITVPQIPSGLIVQPTAIAAMAEPDFFADPNDAHAASAWLLVHMLELGPSADLRERFATYLAGLDERGDNQTLYFTSSFPTEELEGTAAAYLEAARRERRVPYAPPPLADPPAIAMSAAEAHLRLAAIGGRRSTAAAEVHAHLDFALADPTTAVRARLLALELGMYDRSQSKASYVDALAAEHPDDLDVLAAQAQLELTRGRPTNQARLILQRMNGRSDLRATDLVRAAVLAAQAHLRDEALRLAEGAVVADPTDSLAHTTLSFVLASRGERERAGVETRLAWMAAGHSSPPWLWGGDDDDARQSAITAAGLPPDVAQPAAGPFSRASVPLGCGLAAPAYGSLQIGTELVLGRHEPWTGAGDTASDDPIVTTNWVPDMDTFVGRTGRVVDLVGLDAAGCAVVRVDTDGGAWLWRVRDMQAPSDS